MQPGISIYFLMLFCSVIKLLVLACLYNFSVAPLLGTKPSASILQVLGLVLFFKLLLSHG